MSHPRYQDLEHSLANHGSFGATDLVARATDGKYFVKNIIHLNVYLNIIIYITFKCVFKHILIL